MLGCWGSVLLLAEPSISSNHRVDQDLALILVAVINVQLSSMQYFVKIAVLLVTTP